MDPKRNGRFWDARACCNHDRLPVDDDAYLSGLIEVRVWVWVLCVGGFVYTCVCIGCMRATVPWRPSRMPCMHIFHSSPPSHPTPTPPTPPTGGQAQVPGGRRERVRGGAQQRGAHVPDHGLPALRPLQRCVFLCVCVCGGIWRACRLICPLQRCVFVCMWWYLAGVGVDVYVFGELSVGGVFVR